MVCGRVQPLDGFLQDMEKKESEFQSYSCAKRHQLEAEVIYLKEKIAGGCDSKSLSDGLDRSLSESAEELNSARKVILTVLEDYSGIAYDCYSLLLVQGP